MMGVMVMMACGRMVMAANMSTSMARVVVLMRRGG